MWALGPPLSLPTLFCEPELHFLVVTSTGGSSSLLLRPLSNQESKEALVVLVKP